jgi:DNA primase
MGKDLERLKQHFPLLEYLQRHDWAGRPVGNGSEFVGLCPLHEENHPSFYVNPHKNLFYCHGCGRGGDLIRFVELSLHLSFPQSISYLRDPAVIEELGIGYAPGGTLRSHLSDLGYSLELLLEMGLIGSQGQDAFCRRVIFPCRQNHGVVNLYGRSIGTAFPHRLLPRSSGPRRRESS